MIVDTSVWIEFVNSTTSTASRWLRERVATNAPVIVTELVMMELLVGTTDEPSATQLRHKLHHFVIEPLAPVQDAERAAAIHRQCRRNGETVRSMIDCLVAAMALRLDVPVAHRDRDFDVIAEHCGLRTVALF